VHHDVKTPNQPQHQAQHHLGHHELEDQTHLHAVRGNNDDSSDSAQVFDRPDNPGTTGSTWRNFKSLCEGRQLAICSSKDICPNGSPASFIGNVFDGKDNGIAVSDGNNEWVTVNEMGRLCKTHTQVAGATPGWEPRDAQNFYRAVKCCDQ
jgi:hypothetical protein